MSGKKVEIREVEEHAFPGIYIGEVRVGYIPARAGRIVLYKDLVVVRARRGNNTSVVELRDGGN